MHKNNAARGVWFNNSNTRARARTHNQDKWDTVLMNPCHFLGALTHCPNAVMDQSIWDVRAFTWYSVFLACVCVWSWKATQGLIKRLNSNHEINCWVVYTFCLWSETDYCTIDRCWSEISPRRRRRQAACQITTHSKAQICCSSQLLGSLLHRLRIMAP